MASFSKAFKFVLGNEGGYVDNPNDGGGKTKYGITIGTLSFFFGNRKATEDDIKAIDEKLAEDVYRKMYWQPLCLDMVTSDAVATAIFDQAVNRGPVTIAKEVQRLIGVKMDGFIGHDTLEAINDANPSGLVKDIANVAEANYKLITQRDESKRIFLAGWLNRVEKLRGLV